MSMFLRHKQKEEFSILVLAERKLFRRSPRGRIQSGKPDGISGWRVCGKIATGGQNKSCAAFVLTSDSNFAANAPPDDFVGFASGKRLGRASPDGSRALLPALGPRGGRPGRLAEASLRAQEAKPAREAQ